jgi:hypothetical protein
MSEKIDAKRLSILVGFVVASVLLTGVGVWWTTQQYCAVDITQSQNNDHVSSRITEGFKSSTVNGVKIYFSSKYTPEEIQKNTEDFTTQSPSGPTFAGESLTFNSKLPYAGVVVSDIKSIEKFATSNTNWNSYLKVIKDTYNNRAVDQKQYSQKSIASMLQINAYVEPYVVEYLETSDGKWRGFWMLSYSGQDINPHISLNARLYNQSTGKLLDEYLSFDSKKSTDFDKQIQAISTSTDKNLDASAEFTKLGERIKAYVKSSYQSDSEVNAMVNDQFLAALRLTK